MPSLDIYQLQSVGFGGSDLKPLGTEQESVSRENSQKRKFIIIRDRSHKND